MINLNKEVRAIITLVLLVITIALLFLLSYDSRHDQWYSFGAGVSSFLTGFATFGFGVSLMDRD